MKKLLLLFLTLGILTACNSNNAEATYKDRFTKYDEQLEITTDMETGCKYIILFNGVNQAGITPLLTSQGTPYCKP
jgi:uncharacterized protein YcfL